jgi:hypothetical protein
VQGAAAGGMVLMQAGRRPFLMPIRHTLATLLRPYGPRQPAEEHAMTDNAVAEDTIELDQMQNAYKAAVEEWIAAIKQEEELASVNHTVAEVDKWEGAHFKEDEIRSKVKAAKKRYEDALREKFFGF